MSNDCFFAEIKIQNKETNESYSRRTTTVIFMVCVEDLSFS